MSKFAVLLLSLLTLGVQAWATDDLDPLALTPACKHKIATSAAAVCNRETKNNPDREHRCLYSQTDIKRNQSNAAYLEVSYTITDGEAYTYGVSITDKTKCEYKVVAKN